MPISIYDMYHNVWIKGMEQRCGADPSNRYGKGVWNGCGPGPCSGPYKLTCTHLHPYISANPYRKLPPPPRADLCQWLS